MYSFILENSKGDQLTFNQIGGAFKITEIEGLNPPDANINTSKIALADGEFFDSAKAKMRTIRLAFSIEKDASANRIKIFNVLKTKQSIRAYFSNEYKNVYIDGYIESINIGYFDMKQICTVAILCPKPYWNGAQTIIDGLSQVVSTFRFPFASLETPEEIIFGYLDPYASVEIANDGDIATGIVITLQARSAVGNPKIIDYITGEYIQLNFSMQAGDLITIDTRAGAKTIKLLRNGVESNIFNSLARGSTWLQLDFNGSVYTYEVGIGNASDLLVNINHINVYEGV